jgi:hypothetical protein
LHEVRVLLRVCHGRRHRCTKVRSHCGRRKRRRHRKGSRQRTRQRGWNNEMTASSAREGRSGMRPCTGTCIKRSGCKRLWGRLLLRLLGLRHELRRASL